MGAAEDNPTANAACPDENVLVSMIEGRLSRERLAVVESHIDRCGSCASMMDELAEVIAPTSTRPEKGDIVIGRYEVLEEIGAGGMGVVYAAYDPELRRKVAIKLLRPDIEHFADVPAARARLLREARLLATLSHPNVVTVFDVGAMGDDIFIAVELVEGRSLADWMVDDRPAWREVAKVYVQAARGLLAAHEAGLVHRDVKPANLLLGRDGSVRVTDFGLATAAGEVSSGVRGASRADTSLVTQTGAIVGTPAYMAPEQYAGRGADARSDQFSFCVSLAEAFTGERPTAGATADDLVAAATANERKPPPALLLDVVAKGLCARAADRHADMAAVAKALELALDGEAERLRSASEEPAPAPSPRTHPPSNLGWMVALVLMGVVVYAYASQQSKGQNVDDRAQPQQTADEEPPPTDAVVTPDPAVLPTATASSPEEPQDSGAVITPQGAPVAQPPTSPVQSATHWFTGAARHHSSGEGAECLSDLAEGAKRDPTRAAGSYYTRIRAQCMMYTGDCAGGRRVLAAMMGASATESNLDAQSIPACRKKKATALQSAEGKAVTAELNQLYTEAAAARKAKDVAKCRAVGAKVDALVAKHNLGSEPQLKHTANAAKVTVTQCLAENADCAAARAGWAKTYRSLYPELMSPDEYDKNLDAMFYSSFPHCKGK